MTARVTGPGNGSGVPVWGGLPHRTNEEDA